MSSDSAETIACAAIQLDRPPGDLASLVVSLPRPARHHEVIQYINELGFSPPARQASQGFLTDTGRFVGREEAMLIANEAEQLNQAFQLRSSSTHILFTEDLW